MKRNYLEIEKFIADFFPNHAPDRLILDPEDFVLLEKNGILDAETILKLQSSVESVLDKGCFVIINDDEVNACAVEKDGVSIIAIYAGTIKNILYNAGIMMLSEDFLEGVGNMAACYSDIHADDFAMKQDGEEDSLVKMTFSGDSCRERIGYMIASLAIHFIVYHEVGHHLKGHVRRLKEKYNLFYKETSDMAVSEEQLEERKQMELEADMFASEMLAEKFDTFIVQWADCFDFTLGYSEMFQLLIPALVIMKENMSSNVYFVKNMEKDYYLPNIIRISIAVMVIARQPHIKKVLSRDIQEMFLEDDEYRKKFEEENGMEVLDDHLKLTEIAYERFYSLMIASTEQTYASIFKGNHLPTTFREDIRAMNWFLYRYQ